MKLDQVMKEAVQSPTKIVAVAAAEDEATIDVVATAIEKKLANFILYGNQEKIKSHLAKRDPNYQVSQCMKIVHAENEIAASKLAVQEVNEGMANVLMKGMVSTAAILKEVLHKEYGLKSGNVLSHLAVFQSQDFDRLLFVTDAAMNIAPNLKEKVEIINNAVIFARKLGVSLPKVATLAAVETVNPAMAATVESAILTQMNRRGQIKNCLIDGPLALDNAISLEACEQKGIKSDVAGMADIILVPTIEVGNVLYKSLVYFAKAKVGALIVGAKVPIVLTSRADSVESKLYSIALAVRSIR